MTTVLCCVLVVSYTWSTVQQCLGCTCSKGWSWYPWYISLTVALDSYLVKSFIQANKTFYLILICGLRNHTRDYHRMICDICAFNNHVLNDCMKCLPWNYGLKLCGTPIKDQNFFYIDECYCSVTTSGYIEY
jgi:hypothetical protein